MRLLAVSDSDIIDCVGYDAEKKQVQIVFKSTPDVVYAYDATADEFATLVASESIGSHFHKNIKKRAFTKSERLKPTLKK